MAICGREILVEARELLPDVVALRRRIHANPELGLDLPETRAAVLEALAEIELEIELSEKTSGLVATLRGARAGPGILLRADMDALPMPEDTGLDFASKIPGRMHACGHDAHTAMLVGAARLLDRHRGELAGSVSLLFQAGEEGYFGAKHMLDEGLLLRHPELRAAFALHVSPEHAAGQLTSRSGPVMAAADVFSVELTGRGGHGSMPHNAIDPIPVACEIVLALQTMITRRVDAFDPAVLTVGTLKAGTAPNIIPATAQITGTLRSVSEHSRRLAQKGIRRVAESLAAAHEVEAAAHVVDGYPPTLNDEEFTQFARRVAIELLGGENYLEMPAPIMGAEDFSYLLQQLPGAMMFLGVRDDSTDPPAPCHSNKMRIDEGAMATGIAMHAAVATRYLTGDRAAKGQ
jgi:hippurate hydrolase